MAEPDTTRRIVAPVHEWVRRMNADQARRARVREALGRALQELDAVDREIGSPLEEGLRQSILALHQAFEEHEH